MSAGAERKVRLSKKEKQRLDEVWGIAKRFFEGVGITGANDTLDFLRDEGWDLTFPLSPFDKMRFAFTEKREGGRRRYIRFDFDYAHYGGPVPVYAYYINGRSFHFGNPKLIAEIDRVRSFKVKGDSVIVSRVNGRRTQYMSPLPLRAKSIELTSDGRVIFTPISRKRGR